MMRIIRASAVRFLAFPLFAPILASLLAMGQNGGHAPFEEDSGLIQKRFEYFYRQRALPRDRIPPGARLRALERMKTMEAKEATAAPNAVKPKWTQVGPKPIDPAQGTAFGGAPTDSGRVTALAVDPTNPNTIYLGAAEGGVWKTTDSGSHWLAVTDYQPSLAVGSIAIDPANSQTVYVGTGEGNFNGDEYYGAGILRTTDGGKTWSLLGGGQGGEFGVCKSGASSLSSVFAGSYIGSIAVSPTNSQVILAGVANCPSDGVFRSSDGGVTWTKVLSGAPGTSVFFPGGTIAYAALGSVKGSSANGIYRSKDTGVTWSPMNGTGTRIVPSGIQVGRIALVSAPSKPSTLYAAFQSPSPVFGAFKGLYTTVDGGAHWYHRGNTPDFCSNQCWYDMVLAVSPVDPSLIYVGGIYDYTGQRQTTVMGSVDGGNTWALVGDSTGGGKALVHTDTHALAFASDGSRLFVGSDGGAWSTTNAKFPNHLNWTGLNSSLATVQFYPGFAIDPHNASNGIGGAQDNGSIVFAGQLKWSNVTCGDGGFSAIDPTTNPSTYYAACADVQNKCLKGNSNYPCVLKSTTPGSPTSWVDASAGIDFSDPALFIPPMTMDPSNPSTLFYGTNRIWQTTNGGVSWAAISRQPLPPGGGDVSTTAPSPSDSQTIYEGASDGTVAVTRDSGQTWTDVSNGLPPRYVTHVAVDPKIPTTAYVTYSGFSGFNGDNQGHVFRTTNAGGNWADISSNLPDIPINDLLVDPNLTSTLYVATDIGVFVTTNRGSSWNTLGTGLPHVAVLSLTIQAATNTIVAATHGRSVWQLGSGSTDWTEFHFRHDGTRLNPFENVLNVNSVKNLSLKWSFTTDFSVASSPAVANGVVYVGAADGSVYALNASTGASLWSFTTGNIVFSSPAVANGVVYVGSEDGNVYALNASTGAKLWSFSTGFPVFSSPAVANGVVYVGSEDQNVYALNASTGAKLWSFTTGYQVFSSPTVANGVLYVGSSDLNVYALNANTGTKLWSFTTDSFVTSSPAVANEIVYVGSGDGNVYALNANTGAKLWSFTTGKGVGSSPAVANGVVYVDSGDGNVYGLNAGTGAKLWSFTTGNAGGSSPAVANGVVYVGSYDVGSDDGNVYALNASTGAKLWSFFITASGVQSSPAVANGVVYVGSDDGNVYAFDLK